MLFINKIEMKKVIVIISLVIVCESIRAQTLKVMTYNIHHGANKANVDKLDEMASFIKASGADLVGLQEVDSVCKRSGNVDQMKYLAEATGMYFAFARHLAFDGGAYGQGILSKYPIDEIRNDRITLIKKGKKRDSRALISVRVNLPNQTKLIFASVHFALDVPSRLLQAEETISYLKTSRMPVVLTGDLNAIPDQEEIINLEKYFAKTEKEDQFTFPVDVPIKKIDYIFVSKKFFKRTIDYTVFNEIKASDHLPAMATIELRSRNK